MKFPGRRDTKHYFPVTDKGRTSLSTNSSIEGRKEVNVVGIDQLLVDIEIEIDDSFLQQYDFQKGQSFIIEDDLCEEIYQYARDHKLIRGEFPGGAVGNTLHNFSVLSDSTSYALGAIKKSIDVGDYAFKYLSKTSGLVDMSFLQPADRPMGRALCFITPDLERTFAISKGCMNDYRPESVPEDIIKRSSALLISAYTLRNLEEPIYHATLKACEFAKKYNIPVVMSLGTSKLVEEKVDYIKEFSKEYVNVLAMNQDEALALTGHEDALLACEDILEIVDLALVTVGKKGLYLASYTDEDCKRKSHEPLVTKSIVNYNEYEYSRGMRKTDCVHPLKIYTHINPYNGGPLSIKNTNGAGDAALCTPS